MSVLSDQSDFSSSARLWDKHEDDAERSAKMFASDDSSESLLLGTHVEQSYPRPAAVSERCESESCEGENCEGGSCEGEDCESKSHEGGLCEGGI